MALSSSSSSEKVSTPLTIELIQSMSSDDMKIKIDELGLKQKDNDTDNRTVLLNHLLATSVRRERKRKTPDDDLDDSQFEKWTDRRSKKHGVLDDKVRLCLLCCDRDLLLCPVCVDCVSVYRCKYNLHCCELKIFIFAKCRKLIYLIV